MKPILLTLILSLTVLAQKVDAPIKLNAKASQRWQQLEKARDEVIKEANRQLNEIANQQRAMREVADIPEDWVCTTGADQIIACKKPEVAKTSPDK